LSHEFQQTQADVPKILLFTTNMVPPNVYNALAFHYRLRLVFGQANNDTGADLITKYKVKKYPQLIVLPFEGRKKWKRYDGKMDYGPLRDFLDTLALDERLPEASMETFYDDFYIPPDFQTLPRLDSSSFNETIIKGDKPSLVFLYHFWSYPSKFWIPSIENIYRSGEFSDAVDMYYLDGDDEGVRDIYLRLGLNKIPALYYFPGNNRKGIVFEGDNNVAAIGKWLKRRTKRKTKKAEKKEEL